MLPEHKVHEVLRGRQGTEAGAAPGMVQQSSEHRAGAARSPRPGRLLQQLRQVHTGLGRSWGSASTGSVAFLTSSSAVAFCVPWTPLTQTSRLPAPPLPAHLRPGPRPTPPRPWLRPAPPLPRPSLLPQPFPFPFLAQLVQTAPLDTPTPAPPCSPRSSLARAPPGTPAARPYSAVNTICDSPSPASPLCPQVSHGPRKALRPHPLSSPPTGSPGQGPHPL